MHNLLLYTRTSGYASTGSRPPFPYFQFQEKGSRCDRLMVHFLKIGINLPRTYQQLNRKGEPYQIIGWRDPSVHKTDRQTSYYFYTRNKTLFEALEGVMCDVIKKSKSIFFLGVSFTTSPLIPPFQTYFYGVTHDTFRCFKFRSFPFFNLFYSSFFLCFCLTDIICFVASMLKCKYLYTMSELHVFFRYGC